MNDSLSNPIKWVLIERTLQILIALLLNVLIARYLGVEQFGILQAALSSVAVFSSIGLLCSAEVVSPLYSQDKEKYTSIFEQVFIIRLVLSVIAIIGYSIYIYVGNQQNIFLMICLMIGILFQEPFNIFGLYFQIDGRQNLLSKIKLSGIFLKLFIVIVFTTFNISSDKFGLPYLLEYILIAFLLLISYRSAKGKLSFLLKFDLTKKLTLSGFIFGIGIAAMIAMQKSDRIILSFLNESIELGIYSAAIQIAENWFLLSSMLIQAIVSKHIYQLDNIQANKTIIKTLFTFLTITILAAITGLFLSEPIMTILYGKQYQGAGYFLSFLLFVAIFVFSDAVLTTKILKNKNGFVFSTKWILALVATYIYILISTKFLNNFKVEYVPAIGYGTATLFSLIYFLKKRHEDLTYHL